MSAGPHPAPAAVRNRSHRRRDLRSDAMNPPPHDAPPAWARPPRPTWRQPLLLAALASLLALGAWWVCAAHDALAPWDTAWLEAQRARLAALQAGAPLAFGLGFLLLFTLLAALALPGCSVLALAAGPCFGWAGGTALVVAGSTAGATLSFLAARHWLREPVRRRFGHHLHALDGFIARDGTRALFALRMAPLVPFPVLNPLLGLTAMPVGRFAAVSALGMLAGSAAYVHAGHAVLGDGSVSATLVLALAVLGVAPWLAARWLRRTGAAT